jgi:hypothetical protein
MRYLLLILAALILTGCAGECIKECRRAAESGCEDDTKCFREVMASCTPVCQGDKITLRTETEPDVIPTDPEPTPNPPIAKEPPKPKVNSDQAWPPQ